MAQLPPPASPSGSPGALRPGSVVPLAPAVRRNRPRAPIAAVAALLLVIAALVAAVAWRAGGNRVVAAARPSPAPASGPAETAADPGPGASPDPSPAPAPSPVSPPLAPPGYQVFHEPAGYWIAVPKSGWSTDTDSISGDRQWWGDLSRTDVKLLFVTMHVVTGNRQSARAALAAYENKEQHGSFIFYHRIRLTTPHPVPGATAMADLEFTNRDQYQTNHFHTYVRFITAPGGRLYTLELAILHDIYNDSGDTESDWRRAVPTARKILGSVRLG